MLNENKLPLRDLPWEEASKLYEAFHRGETVEYWDEELDWQKRSMPGQMLFPEDTYRIAPCDMERPNREAALQELAKLDQEYDPAMQME